MPKTEGITVIAFFAKKKGRFESCTVHGKDKSPYPQLVFGFWGMGLLGVVTSFALRITEGFDSLMLHREPKE